MSIIGSVAVLALYAVQPNGGPRADPPDGSPAARKLRGEVLDHLAAGRVDVALLAAQQAYERNRDDPSIRHECVSLHLSLARRLVAMEDFAAADAALKAVLRIEPDEPAARGLVKLLDEARARAPASVDRARQWLEVEWFEPAFRTFAQATGLRPDRAADWSADYRRAAVGAGDDHYFTKNFHEAFYCYDAAMHLSGDAAAVSPELVSRWLQSMAHALGRDVDAVRYPDAYWTMVLQRVGAARMDRSEAAPLRAMVRGLAYEDLGRPAEAAREYGVVLGRPVVALEPDLVRRARRSALQAIRKWYDPALSDRRRGTWEDHATGDWTVIDAPRFRIHHRNAAAARRVVAALEFHFVRCAQALGRSPEDVPWPVPADVFLYADGAAFRTATGRPEEVHAVSVIRRRGERLERHEIHVHQADPMLLSTTLAHELAHLMTGAATGYAALPAALGEGIALHVEPRCRHLQFARVFGGLDSPRSLADLLAMDEHHPPEPAFYAEAHRLMSVLTSRGEVRHLIAGADGADSLRDPAALARLYGFDGTAELRREYLGRMESPSAKR